MRGIATSLLFACCTTLAANVQAEETENKVAALLEQARAAENAGSYPAAEGIYRQALSIAPDNSETLKRLGILEQTELKFDDSIQHFKQALATDPSYKGVNFFLGVSYFGKNDYPQAIESFTRELKTPNPHPRCHYYFALALQASGRLDEAMSHFHQSLEQNPKDADALYELARLHKNASLRAIEMLKALDPDSFQLHALMGEIDADQERYSDAIGEYQAALAKRPDAQGMHFAIGVAYWTQGQMDSAEKSFQEALNENPNDPMTNLYLGDIAVRNRRFSEALPFLLIAQRGQPNMAQLHVLLGRCYHDSKKFDLAKAEFQAAITADPAAAQPHFLLAGVYRDLHDTQGRAAELAEFERLSKLEQGKSSPRSPQN